MKLARHTALSALTICFCLASGKAQDPASENKAEAKPAQRVESHSDSATPSRYVDTRPYKTFYLKNAVGDRDGNEILTALRLLLDPTVKLYLTPSQKSISVRGTDADLAMVQHVLDDLDRPKKVLLITYTVSESDGGKRIGLQHYALTATTGQRATLKQGSKVPIVTGAYAPGKTDQATQMTYLDVGLNFDATPEDYAGGVSLKTKIEQSSVAPEPSGIGATDPIIRQSVLESVTSIPYGKMTDIGSVDVPGSTRHLDIEVQVDLVK
jgi:type II secretory pathway component GspD/PulD (secretin)